MEFNWETTTIDEAQAIRRLLDTRGFRRVAVKGIDRDQEGETATASPSTLICPWAQYFQVRSPRSQLIGLARE